jgi:hypothetical protein
MEAPARRSRSPDGRPERGGARRARSATGGNAYRAVRALSNAKVQRLSQLSGTAGLYLCRVGLVSTLVPAHSPATSHLCLSATRDHGATHVSSMSMTHRRHRRLSKTPTRQPPPAAWDRCRCASARACNARTHKAGRRTAHPGNGKGAVIAHCSCLPGPSRPAVLLRPVLLHPHAYVATKLVHLPVLHTG